MPAFRMMPTSKPTHCWAKPGGLRNPDVNRNHPRLHPEAEEEKQKNDALLKRRHAQGQQVKLENPGCR